MRLDTKHKPKAISLKHFDRTIELVVYSADLIELQIIQVKIEEFSLNLLHHYNEGQLRLNEVRYAELHFTTVKREVSKCLTPHFHEPDQFHVIRIIYT